MTGPTNKQPQMANPEIDRDEIDRRVIVSDTRSNNTEYYAFWNPQYLSLKDNSWKPEHRFGDDRRGCEHDGNTSVEWKRQRNNDGSLDGEEICEDCDSRWPIKVDEYDARID